MNRHSGFTSFIGFIGMTGTTGTTGMALIKGLLKPWALVAMLACLGLIALAALLLPAAVNAQSNTDYDSDDDGLIEVANLAQLNVIRWDLDGDGGTFSGNDATNYAAAFPNAASGMGCPTNADDADDNDCIGYELTADLDFDTNGDGVTNVTGDTYWNAGKGWTPIGGNFTAEFDGNGHTIANLFVDRPSGFAGLFASIHTTGKVRNLGLVDVDVTSTGSQKSAGGLAGVSNGDVSFSYVSGGTVDSAGAGDAGGLVDRPWEAPSRRRSRSQTSPSQVIPAAGLSAH